VKIVTSLAYFPVINEHHEIISTP